MALEALPMGQRRAQVEDMECFRKMLLLNLGKLDLEAACHISPAFV